MSLMIGVPCYGGSVFCEFTQSLIRLTKILQNHKINHEVVFLGNESLISRGRNSLLAKFYGDSTFTHLLFLDADLIFNPECIIKMMGQNKEIIGCPYPKKAINYNKLKKFKSPEDNLHLITDINYNLLEKGVLKKTIIEAKDIPTGCMLIRRSLVTALIMNFPERKYINNIAGMGGDQDDYFYDFFGVGVVDGYYLSEDYYFCHLVRQLNIPLYLEIGYTFGHIGRQTFYGNLMAQFEEYGFQDELNADKIELKKKMNK
jgi:hypothetical protein